MRKIRRQIVAALIFSQDHKLLMGMKNPDQGGVWPDCWHIPGGGIEAGEAQTQALQREVHEETGLDITAAKVQLIDDKGKMETTKRLKENDEEVQVEMQFFVYQ